MITTIKGSVLCEYIRYEYYMRLNIDVGAWKEAGSSEFSEFK